jgi:hypothetical protein
MREARLDSAVLQQALADVGAPSWATAAGRWQK